MESLPLKELDFGLQKPTGPSSGVVSFHSFDYNCFVFSKFFFFLHNSHTFQIVLEDTFTSKGFSRIRIVVSKIIKIHKVIIFISLERSCVTLLDRINEGFFFFPFYCRVFFFFLIKCLKNFFFFLNNEVSYGNSLH